MPLPPIGEQRVIRDCGARKILDFIFLTRCLLVKREDGKDKPMVGEGSVNISNFVSVCAVEI